jgi:hypothetical protein
MNENDIPSYFTSAFPTLFPWGGYHNQIEPDEQT